MAKNIIIIGGGASGMLAAIFAARGGANVKLFERNEKLGKKVYITGKGRCNVTNAADSENFFEHIYRSRRFPYAAMSTLSNRDMMDMMESLGVPLKVERGDRVFPESDKASDIIFGLKREMDRLGVRVYYNMRVMGILTEGGRASGVELENGQKMASDAVILATGGMSYPLTGSTGDGYRMAEGLGHDITALYPALTPVETEEKWTSELTGLSLKNVVLRAYAVGKKKPFYSEMGEMMFTHFGITGPLVLKLSSLLPEGTLLSMNGKTQIRGVRLEIDLKPALDESALDARIVRDLAENTRSRIVTIMDGLEPHNLGLEILRQAEISQAKPANSITKEERRRLVALIKALPLTPSRLRGFEEAIITRGGIETKGVNPSTMESKYVPGLYIAGEVLDVDASTGGFNLQIAFSTGALAGMCAAEEWAE